MNKHRWHNDCGPATEGERAIMDKDIAFLLARNAPVMLDASHLLLGEDGSVLWPKDRVISLTRPKSGLAQSSGT